MNTQQLAEAFSSHRFTEVYEHLRDDVVWVLPGQASIEGRTAVVEACTHALEEFGGLAEASFDRFVSAASADVAAVDAIGRYVASDGTTSVVSSADIYEFDAEGRLVRITSYAVELPTQS